MTLEQRIEMHEQWLSSMEASHAQLAEDLGRYEKVFAEHMATVTLQMGVFATALARQTEEHEREHRKFEQGLQDLRDLIDRYIRFRGNGHEPAN